MVFEAAVLNVLIFALSASSGIILPKLTVND